MSPSPASNNVPLFVQVIDGYPPERYGKGKARILRRLVHVIYAKFGTPDGGNCYPSPVRIAYLCGVHESAIRKTLKWLAAEGLIDGERIPLPSKEQLKAVQSAIEHKIEAGREQARLRKRRQRHANKSNVTLENVTPIEGANFENVTLLTM